MKSWPSKFVANCAAVLALGFSGAGVFLKADWCYLVALALAGVRVLWGFNMSRERRESEDRENSEIE
jgi:hypothetical protein